MRSKGTSTGRCPQLFMRLQRRRDFACVRKGGKARTEKRVIRLADWPNGCEYGRYSIRHSSVHCNNAKPEVAEANAAPAGIKQEEEWSRASTTRENGESAYGASATTSVRRALIDSDPSASALPCHPLHRTRGAASLNVARQTGLQSTGEGGCPWPFYRRTSLSAANDCGRPQMRAAWEEARLPDDFSATKWVRRARALLARLRLAAALFAPRRLLYCVPPIPLWKPPVSSRRIYLAHAESALFGKD
ncbi:hypothetical protein HPB50_016653 [Hyalomma asiaticum]|uniref:Uncharacterized protein n=1 Tax=Hyalomma asiaticum TaxID=266040 RepID=A0ACB7TL07_HYAAI|nr:hypothetical protein HPB50_016653 [Hyalomma asiaticum]